MSEFINTTDVLGDDAVCDGIITKTLVEYADNHIISVGSYVFYNCTTLTLLDLPVATSIGVFSFYGCSSLKTINLPVAIEIGNYAFYNGHVLESINMPFATSIGKSAFRYCYALATADMPDVTTMGTYVFYGCSALTTVILRSDTMCTLESTNSFTDTPIADGTGYIYVPTALVESYVNGTNWSEYGSQIRAIEDYPDITGG